MKVHRTKHTANFTIAPNAILREERMSEMARLILLRLLSNADNYEGATALKMWEDAREVRGDAAPGKRAFLNAFNEMEAFGYLVRTKVREGRKWVTRVDVYDTPQSLEQKTPEAEPVGLPGFGKPHGGMPHDGKSESGQSSKRTTEKDASRRTISSSSVPVTPEVEDVTPSRMKTKRSPEDIVLEQLAHMTPTLEEADAVVTLVIAKAAAKGTRVENPTRWIDGRDKRVLEQDLEDVRRASRVALSGECVLHEVSLESGACSSCMGDIKAGDAEAIRAHLLEVGADSRPDLVAVLGAPHVPAQATAGGWTWEGQLRRERRARNGVKGGVTEPVPDHTYWETVTDEQLKASL